jgi:hypothetical protein
MHRRVVIILLAVVVCAATFLGSVAPGSSALAAADEMSTQATPTPESTPSGESTPASEPTTAAPDPTPDSQPSASPAETPNPSSSASPGQAPTPGAEATRLVNDLDAGNSRRLSYVSLTRGASFSPNGGFAIIDPWTSSAEIIYFRMVDENSVGLIDVLRFQPTLSHSAGAEVIDVGDACGFTGEKWEDVCRGVLQAAEDIFTHTCPDLQYCASELIDFALDAYEAAWRMACPSASAGYCLSQYQSLVEATVNSLIDNHCPNFECSSKGIAQITEIVGSVFGTLYRSICSADPVKECVSNYEATVMETIDFLIQTYCPDLSCPHDVLRRVSDVVVAICGQADPSACTNTVRQLIERYCANLSCGDPLIENLKQLLPQPPCEGADCADWIVTMLGDVVQEHCPDWYCVAEFVGRIVPLIQGACGGDCLALAVDLLVSLLDQPTDPCAEPGPICDAAPDAILIPGPGTTASRFPPLITFDGVDLKFTRFESDHKSCFMYNTGYGMRYAGQLSGTAASSSDFANSVVWSSSQAEAMDIFDDDMAEASSSAEVGHAFSVKSIKGDHVVPAQLEFAYHIGGLLDVKYRVGECPLPISCIVPNDPKAIASAEMSVGLFEAFNARQSTTIMSEILTEDARRHIHRSGTAIMSANLQDGHTYIDYLSHGTYAYANGGYLTGMLSGVSASADFRTSRHPDGWAPGAVLFYTKITADRTLQCGAQ